jgi:hypothetical protein
MSSTCELLHLFLDPQQGWTSCLLAAMIIAVGELAGPFFSTMAVATPTGCAYRAF